MRRRIALACALIAVGASLGAATAARPAVRPAIVGRSFTIRADAFPIEPAPGSNGVALGIRPAATRLVVANPPVEAYARAAAADLTAIEQQVGPPPAGTAAECDSASGNVAPRAHASPAGMTLSAVCNGSPWALASAIARELAAGEVNASAITSTVTGGVAGDALVGTARASLTDLTIGALRVTAARFVGSVRMTGRPGGATASGTIEIVEATIGGVPVTVGPDGVAVDETRVPTEQLAAATAAVHDALSQGGYADVRLLQPRGRAAADGTSASLSGGGLLIYLTNNDPSSTYFVGLTLLGASVRADLGSALELASGGPPVSVGPDSAPGEPAGSAAVPVARQPVVRAPSPDRELSATRALYTGPQAWDGWIWLIIASATLVAAGWASRRRFMPWWNEAADRYLRG
jgi:hypothetical protein